MPGRVRVETQSVTWDDFRFKVRIRTAFVGFFWALVQMRCIVINSSDHSVISEAGLHHFLLPVLSIPQADKRNTQGLAFSQAYQTNLTGLFQSFQLPSENIMSRLVGTSRAPESA